MASNLRVDSIVPATGSSVSIGTATGGVNIPGVLTYEDVTNVDSVGVITARSGIRIGATGANTLINGNTAGIGIGTANPQSILDISKDISAGVNDVNIRNHHPTGGAALRVKTQGTYGSPLYHGILGASDSGGTIRVGAVSNHPLLLLTNNTEKLRIGESGQLGIGGANYGTAGQVLTSQGSGSAVQWASSSSHTLLHTVSLDLVSAGSNTKTQALNLSGYLKLYGLITGVQRSPSIGDMWLTFNGSNTSGEYSWIRSYVDNGGAVATTGSQNGIAYGSVGPGFFGNIAGVNAYTSGNNYWAFTLHGIQENGKVYESHSVGYLNNNMVVNTTGYFQQSAAITSITFNVYSSTYRTSGGTMKLYGVK